MKWKKKKEYSENEPCIGMTKGEVLNSDWGMPTEINKTTYEWGVSEQWVYPDNKYIYIEEDVVVAITGRCSDHLLPRRPSSPCACQACLIGLSERVSAL